MADEVTTETTVDATDTDVDTTDTTGDADDLGDGGKKALDSERGARKAAEKALREAQAALQAIEDKGKSELQLTIARAEAAEKKAAKELRGRIAATKGVPADSISGETEEELTEAADRLIAWKGDNAKPDPKPDATKKKAPAPGGTGLKSGASGNGDTKTDPKERAAEAIRRLTGGS